MWFLYEEYIVSIVKMEEREVCVWEGARYETREIGREGVAWIIQWVISSVTKKDEETDLNNLELIAVAK